MKKVTVLPGQTLFDIVIQEKGSLEGLFDVMASNNLNASDELEAGDTVIIEGDPADRQTLKYITKKKIKPATRISSASSSSVSTTLGGIGYWIIEDDFVVS